MSEVTRSPILCFVVATYCFRLPSLTSSALRCYFPVAVPDMGIEGHERHSDPDWVGQAPEKDRHGRIE